MAARLAGAKREGGLGRAGAQTAGRAILPAVSSVAWLLAAGGYI